MNPFTGGSSTFSWGVKDPLLNRGYDRLSTQGALALVDCRLEDGGFFACPVRSRHLTTLRGDEGHHVGW